MKKRKKTRTGSSPAWARAARLTAAVALALAFGPPLAGSDKKSKQKEQVSYAVVAGTVFRETGLSFGGAEVTLTASGGAEAARKFKKMSTTANSRGEFAFHVPALPMEYTLTARAPGYQPQQKPASISGEIRVDVFFTLEPTSK